MNLVDSYFKDPTAGQTWREQQRALSDDEHKAFSDMINFLHFLEMLSATSMASGVSLESMVLVLSSGIAKPNTGFVLQDEHLARLRKLVTNNQPAKLT